MATATISWADCTLGVGVSQAADGSLSFALAEGVTLTSGDLALGPGTHEVSLELRMSTTRLRLPDISIAVHDAHGDLLCSRRVSTRAQRATLRFHCSEPRRARIVLCSNHSSFNLVRIDCREVALGAASDQLRARRDVRRSMIARLGLGATKPRESDALDVSPEEVDATLFACGDVDAYSSDALGRHAEAIRAVGLDLSALQALFETNNTLSQAEAPSPGASLMTGNPKLTNRFQDDLVREESLSVPDPYSGKPRTTTCGYALDVVPMLATIVYEFDGPNPFIIGTSLGWPGNLAFVWLVDDDLIIYQDLNGTDWVDPQQVICQYVASCLGHKDEVRRYRRSDHSVALVSGVVANMGHYFWNDASGLERVVRNGNSRNVTAVYTTPNPWLSVAEMFGSDLSCPVLELSSTSELFVELLRSNRLPVRPSASSIDRELAERIHHVAEGQARRSPSVILDRLDGALRSAQLIFFVNLRTHNKSWREQVDGVAAMVERLHSHHGRNVLVYLDGYADCDEAVSLIQSSVAHLEVDVVVGTSARFCETILWAYACHLFVAVVGSGLVPLTWLADKSGIAHSDVEHLKQLSWWREVQGASSATLLAPSPEDIVNVSDDYYSDYSISPAVFVELLDSLVAQQMERM